MKRSKGMQLGAMLAGVLLVGLFASVASAQTPVPTNVPPVDNVTVDTTSGSDILSPSKEVQKIVFDAIQQSSNLTDNEKKDLTKQLKDIWSGKSELTQDEQRQVLTKVAYIVSETQVGILWKPQQHSDIAYLSAWKSSGTSWAVPSQYWNTLYYYSGGCSIYGNGPDCWDFYSEHAWWVDTNSGDAPYKARNYADAARNYLKNGNPSEGYKNLAYSMHYMADVGVPFHTDSTGALFTGQYSSQHVAYEGFVDTNWNSGSGSYNFKADVQNDWYYYYITDPEATAKSIANGAHQYYWYIVNRMGSSNWQNDPTLVSYTRDSLKYASRGDLGLVNYVNR